MADDWIVKTALSERFPFYTRANVGEVFPDPVAPLSFSFAFQSAEGLGGAEMGFRNAYVRLGAFEHDEFPDDECVFLGVAGGYCYLNASAMRLLGHRAPGMTYKDIDDSFFGDAPDVPPFVEQPGDERLDLTARIGETFQWALTTESLPDVLEDEEIVNRLRAERPDVTALSDEELIGRIWDIFDTHFARLFTQHIYVTMLATLPIGIITQVSAALGDPTATLKLIAGLGDVESAAPSMAMWDLGRSVCDSAALTPLFDGGHAGLDDRLRASDDADVASWVADFDRFLLAYGSRGPNEWETRSPTWETEPDLALAAIDRMRLSPAEASPYGHNEERAAEREALGAAMAGHLEGDPEAHGQFLAALSAAKVFMPGRERTKTNCVKLIQESRVCLQEWGRRMHAAGHFPRANSYGMLTRSEQAEFLADPTGWRDLLSEREALYDVVKALQEPFVFVGHPDAMTDYPRRDAVSVERLAAGDSIQAVPGCPGVATGRARVVLDSHDPTSLVPGDILVAPITDPSWTPLFVPAAGVVVDVGAPLSHAIIVSRELGIPCVVSATDGTKRIPDGALIEVDGDTGKVSVLEI